MASAEMRKELEDYLKGLNIETVCEEHPEVFTVEAMMPYVQHLKGAHSKNLFLKDKKKKCLWLVTVLHNRQVNLNDLAKKLGSGSGNLRFADEGTMLEKLKVGQESSAWSNQRLSPRRHNKDHFDVGTDPRVTSDSSRISFVLTVA
uniref:prolyl-tRNA synthetase associated domain-containing protein 1 isoform X2 n=1 Tax=Pristiophorus japonicus TaxID=55135 RepID=UPI00398F0D67